MGRKAGGLGVGWGGCRSCRSVAFTRGAMNIVDKLTPNSKTVVNTEEEKKTF